jgi:hypothetical protein
MAKNETKAGATAPANTNEATAPANLEEALVIIADQNVIIAELSAEIAKLESKVVEYKAGGLVLPEVVIENKTYLVNNGTFNNGTKYTREELAENQSLCESILAIDGQATLTLKLDDQ